jgi:hypothetical protein
VQSLEAKFNVSSVTLTLKDGTQRRVPGRELWETVFRTQEAWSRYHCSLPPEQRVFGIVPKEVVKAVPLLQTILDTVKDDADGYAVNLIQNFCSGPNVGNPRAGADVAG